MLSENTPAYGNRCWVESVSNLHNGESIQPDAAYRIPYPLRVALGALAQLNALTCCVLVATQLISWLSSGFHRGCSELIIESTDTSFILCGVIEAGSAYALNDYHKGNLF
ncbi:hypothetical protein [Serratia sp. 201]|uniref:hypothetical protein n=1 Tax=Serratia sp. 201 TaxID=3096764 RepID=UPI00300BD54D